MKARFPWAVMLALVFWAAAAYGDGGALLLHQGAGPFAITLYAAPVPLTTGLADLSVIVQQRDSGQVLLDPVVEIAAAQQSVRLAKGNSANRFTQSGVVRFLNPGRYRLDVRVRRGSDVVQVSTECLVVRNTSRAWIICFYLLLPVIVILIFLWHQYLKRMQRQ